MGPEIAGIVVDPSGRPAAAASLRALDITQAGTVVAETATGPDGRFVLRNLQPGAQYELVAVTATAGQRMIGSAVASPPNGSALIQLRADFGSTVSPLGYRLDGPAPRPALLAAGGIPGQVQVTTPPMIWPTNPAAELAPPAPPRREAPLAPPALQPETPSAAPAAPPQSTPPTPAPQRLVPPEAPPAPSSDGRPPPAADASNLAFAGTTLRTLPVLTLAGEPRSLGELRGDWILLDFFGSWCGPCRRAIPELNQLRRRYGNQGLMVVGIACEHGERGRALVQAQQAVAALGIEYSVLVSPLDEPSLLREAFRIDSYPTLVLLDRAGTIRFRAVGADAATFRRLDEAIRTAIAGSTR